MSTDTTGAIDIQPGALLATAAGETTIEQLNSALAPHGLCLPVFPLVAGLTLADLVARNAGGRRRLRYGPVGRHLRAAVLDQRAPSALSPQPSALSPQPSALSPQP